MLERLKLDPQTHIYLELVSPGEVFKYVLGLVPHPCIQEKPPPPKKKKKKKKKVRKKDGATGLKLGMQTQLDYAINMGWVPSGHNSSSVYMTENVKHGTSKNKKKTLRPNHKLIFVLKDYKIYLQRKHFSGYSSPKVGLPISWGGVASKLKVWSRSYWHLWLEQCTGRLPK